MEHSGRLVRAAGGEDSKGADGERGRDWGIRSARLPVRSDSESSCCRWWAYSIYTSVLRRGNCFQRGVIFRELAVECGMGVGWAPRTTLTGVPKFDRLCQGLCIKFTSCPVT